jgi:hypothetical protein
MLDLLSKKRHKRNAMVRSYSIKLLRKELKNLERRRDSFKRLIAKLMSYEELTSDEQIRLKEFKLDKKSTERKITDLTESIQTLKEA